MDDMHRDLCAGHAKAWSPWNTPYYLLELLHTPLTGRRFDIESWEDLGVRAAPQKCKARMFRQVLETCATHFPRKYRAVVFLTRMMLLGNYPHVPSTERRPSAVRDLLLDADDLWIEELLATHPSAGLLAIRAHLIHVMTTEAYFEQVMRSRMDWDAFREINASACAGMRRALVDGHARLPKVAPWLAASVDWKDTPWHRAVAQERRDVEARRQDWIHRGRGPWRIAHLRHQSARAPASGRDKELERAA